MNSEFYSAKMNVELRKREKGVRMRSEVGSSEVVLLAGMDARNPKSVIGYLAFPPLLLKRLKNLGVTF